MGGDVYTSSIEVSSTCRITRERRTKDGRNEEEEKTGSPPSEPDGSARPLLGYRRQGNHGGSLHTWDEGEGSYE